MLYEGKKLFAKIHKRKYQAHHNHEIHFMACEMDKWLPEGAASDVFDGNYTPRPLKRFYFQDRDGRSNCIYQIEIFQYILLEETIKI